MLGNRNRLNIGADDVGSHDCAPDRFNILQPDAEASKVAKAARTMSHFINVSPTTMNRVGGCGSKKRTLAPTSCNFSDSFFGNLSGHYEKLFALS